MRFSVIGVNFRTAPVEIRERASFTSTDIPAMLQRLAETFPGSEAALLSTCNRTELYTAGIDTDAAKETVIRLLLREASDDGLAEAAKHFYTKRDMAVAEHLLTVASGLDSMVVGETEILGQVKQAYMLARQTWSKGRSLDSLFQSAFRVAKRVHTETDLSRGRVSVSSIAVEFAERLFENLGDKTVMIIGAGETAELALKSLIERGARDVLVLNRSLDKANALA
ncbi:MAG: glutamyl-tRNA reductase, partial [bacterium]